MCNTHTAPESASIEWCQHVGRDKQLRGIGVLPKASASFIRLARDDCVSIRVSYPITTIFGTAVSFHRCLQ